MSGYVVAGLLLATALVPRAAEAQVVTDRVDVRIVEVEAVVEGPEGRVRGLSLEDFEILVDGDPVEASHFRAVDRATPSESGEGLEAPSSQPSLSVLVFIDDVFLIQRHRDPVLRALESSLDLLRPGDQLSLIRFDGRQLTVPLPWTTSRDSMRAGVSEAIAGESQGLFREVEKERIQQLAKERQEARSQALASAFKRERLGYQERFSEPSAEELHEVDRMVRLIETSAAAAASALRSVSSGAAGRKVALLLLGGWQFDPWSQTLEHATVLAGVLDQRDPSEIYAPLLETASRLGYTLYPVDVPGLEGLDLTDVEAAAISDDSPAGGRPPALLPEQNVHSALRFLARETGGRAFIDDLRLSALPKAVEDASSYYELAFVPPWLSDDEFHDIEVRVRSELRFSVRSRRSYADPSPETTLRRRLEEVLYGNAPINEPVIELQQYEPGREKRGRIEVELVLGLPTATMVFLPADGGYVAEAEVATLSFDARGGYSNLIRSPIRIATPRLPPAGTIIPWTTRWTLRAVEQRVVVGLMDPVAEGFSVLRLDLDDQGQPKKTRKKREGRGAGG